MNQQYIKLCDLAYPIQQDKWKRGFKEGDWFWDGKETCLCGFDYVNVKHNYIENYGDKFVFTFFTKEMKFNPTIESNEKDMLISFGIGEYCFKQFINPLWLPTQEQLQELLKPIMSEKTMLTGLHIFMNKYEYNTEFTINCFWLLFTMKILYNLVWEPREERFIKRVKNE